MDDPEAEWGWGEEEEVDEDDEDGTEEPDDDDDEDGYRLHFDGEVDPLHLAQETPHTIELYRQFERLEYEALAERKRNSLAARQPPRDDPSKKRKQEQLLGATAEEIEEMMSFGFRRRRSKKNNELGKKGIKKGTKKKLSPELSKKLGDATLLYSSKSYDRAIRLLEVIVKEKPNLSDSYYLLGLIYYDMGDKKKAMNFHMIAAHLTPKDPALWEKLIGWSIEQGNTGQVRYCLGKAITADPKDVGLRFKRALVHLELGEFRKAAETYHQVVDMYPANLEARTRAAKMYQKCGQIEKAVSVLEDYVNGRSGAEMSVVSLLIDLLIEANDHAKALQHIQRASSTYASKKNNLPFYLKLKAAVCHAHLGSMEDAEILLRKVQIDHPADNASSITAAADSFMNLGHFAYALKFYLLLKGNACHEDQGNLCMKIAQCYVSMKEGSKSLPFFYEALSNMDGNIDTRIMLSSLLVEEGKADDAIALLGAPKDSITESACLDSTEPKPWWLDGKIKVHLAKIYLAKGMLEGFVDTIFSYVQKALIVESRHRKLKTKSKKRLRTSVLHERVKLLDEQPDNVFHGFRPIAKSSDLLKAARAKKALQKKEALREERKSAAVAAGVDWESEDSDDGVPRELGQSPLPTLLEDEGQHQLIFDLSYALLSLQRYWEAFEIIYPSLQVAPKKMSIERNQELHALAAKIAYKTRDSNQAFRYAKYMVKQHPDSTAAWNAYYKVVSRFENSQHLKFLRRMRDQDEDLVPPIVIHGHQFTLHSHHQDAVRTYLEAYKLQPDNALINLCVGTAMINLALGFRLQNKHQCVAQGFAFLCNYLKICHNSQEALYNMARACHHIGLVTLAVAYYEKVLVIQQKDYPIPKLPIEDSTTLMEMKPGYCDLRREAAHNLHLIYKKSGAIDLARQVLRDYCNP